MSHHTEVFICVVIAYLALIASAWRSFYVAERVRRQREETESACEHCTCHSKGLYCCHCLARVARA